MNNFLEIKNHDVIKLSPKYLDDNLKEHIQRTLKNKYEGLCSKFGYIKTDSINILNIKEGTVERSTFHGYVKYNVEFSALICNPAINSVIECTVKNINSFGVLCVSGIKEKGVFNSILNIIVPKNHHNFEISNNIEFDKLSIGDSVFVEILGKKYILNNKNINVFGRIVDNNKAVSKDMFNVNNADNTVDDDASSDDEELELEDNDNENDMENENDNDSEIEGGDIDNDVDKESSILDDDKSDDDIDGPDDMISEHNSVSDNEEAFD